MYLYGFQQLHLANIPNNQEARSSSKLPQPPPAAPPKSVPPVWNVQQAFQEIPSFVMDTSSLQK